MPRWPSPGTAPTARGPGRSPACRCTGTWWSPGAWWDYVDEIASHRVGDVLRAHPDTEAERMREWARDPDLWVRRAAILSQLSSKDELDRQLLLDVIEPNLADPDFFIRKAIGWALRQHAHLGREAGDWVREVVAAYGERLSPLSRREALKNL